MKNVRMNWGRVAEYFMLLAGGVVVAAILMVVLFWPWPFWGLNRWTLGYTVGATVLILIVASGVEKKPSSEHEIHLFWDEKNR